MGAYGDLWGPIGTYGDLWGLVGAYWGLWGPIGANGDLWGPMGTYGDLWGPMGTYRGQWGHMGTYGDLWGPMGTYGVGGINFLHTHLDTPPPFLQASDLYQTYHTSCCIHYKNNMPHETSDFLHNPAMALLGLFSWA